MAWTRDPVTAAARRPLWPDHAEDWTADDRRKLKHMKSWRYDDPRPQSGYAVVGRYCDAGFADCDHPIHRAYECVRCGLRKSIGVDHNTGRYQQIRFTCPACRKTTRHNPSCAGHMLELLG